MVVQSFGHFRHAYDAGYGEAVLRLDFLLRGGYAALSDLHAVKRYDKALDLDVCSARHNGIGFVDRLARRGHVFDHDHTVAVVEGRAQQVAGVGAVVFSLFAVAAVAHLFAIELLQRDGGHDGQRNALVGRTEHDVEIEAEVVMNGLGVVLAQALELLARHVGACIHEERRLAAAFQGELAEFEHIAFNHELDEFAFVIFHSAELLRFAPGPNGWAINYSP